MHSRYYATTRIYKDGASCRFVVTLRNRLVAASGVGRGGGGGLMVLEHPFLPQTVQEVYLKDPAEPGATSFVSGLSEVVACLLVS